MRLHPLLHLQLHPEPCRGQASQALPRLPIVRPCLWRLGREINGKLHYYGPWADPEGALARYERRAQEPHPKIASSTDAAKALKAKPTKPDKDFPLWSHKSGQWARWVHGHLHYFGTEADAALAKWLKQKDDLLAGREPVEEGGSLTLGRLCNLFLAAKQTLVGSGEIQVRTWHDYHWTAKRMVEVSQGAGRQVANLTPADFEKLRADFARLTRPRPYQGHHRVRVIFKYAADSDMIDRPVRYGQSFKKPSKAMLRKVRQSKPPRMFTAEEIQKIIKKAGIQLRAMVHLGVNCGMGDTTALSWECGTWTLRTAGSITAGPRREFPADAHFGPRLWQRFREPWPAGRGQMGRLIAFVCSSPMAPRGTASLR